MTKESFLVEVNRVNILTKIADDTSRSYSERDLARVMDIATLCLLKKDYTGAVTVLKIGLEELDKRN